MALIDYIHYIMDSIVVIIFAISTSCQLHTNRYDSLFNAADTQFNTEIWMPALKKASKKAAKIRRHIFNSIGIEYWLKTQKNRLRLVNAGTYIEHNSGNIII